MDVPRQRTKSSVPYRKIAVTVLLLAAFGGAVFAFSQLKPALAVVEGDKLAFDRVTRGTMLREVKGIGRLVPEYSTIVTSETNGRVKEVFEKAGEPVEEGDVLVVIENPDAERVLMDSQLDLRSANAATKNLEVSIQRQQLDLRASTATAVASYKEAILQAEIDDELWRHGLISGRQHKLSQSRAEQALELRDIQLSRVELSQATVDEQMAIQEQRVVLAEHRLKLQTDEVEAMRVKATASGVLQQVGPTSRSQLEVGQRIGQNAVMAVIIDPAKLKAELDVPQAQAQDIEVGQSVAISAVSSRNVTKGRVVRIDPAVQQGTVTVEVELIEDLPNGARPDLSVYGTVEIERLDDTLYVGRPLYGQSDTVIRLFVVSPDGTTATQRDVTLGRTSVSTVEVVEGLREGEQIILSDMSKWAEFEDVEIR